MAGSFVTLHVDTGPGGICSLDMPGATTLQYAALRFAEYLGLDDECPRWFFLDVATKQPYARESLAADYNGATFVLGVGPLNK